jgi:DNA-binding NtrC family response regulator
LGLAAKEGRNMDHRCEILIVDDEPIVGERLKAFLEKDGYLVESFVDPAQALQRLEAKDFDIVISDIRMQEIDGIQVMEKALQKSRRIKVIMITGYATLELARESLTKGAFDFIAKPFKLKEIRRTIKRAVEALEPGGQQTADAETV